MESTTGLSRKLLSYSIGAGAATLAAASAHGEIFVTDFSADPITASTIDFNLMDPAVLPSETGANFELTTKVSKNNTPKAKNFAESTGAGTLLNGSYAAELGAGATIGSGSTFGSGYSTLTYGGTGPWKVGDRGYLGLEISVTDPTTMTTKTLYGWADISLNNLPAPNPTTTGTAQLTTNAATTPGYTLYAYAYENNGSPILAGVPEPKSTVALLIAGAAGAVALRRRRTPAPAQV